MLAPLASPLLYSAAALGGTCVAQAGDRFLPLNQSAVTKEEMTNLPTLRESVGSGASIWTQDWLPPSPLSPHPLPLHFRALADIVSFGEQAGLQGRGSSETWC